MPRQVVGLISDTHGLVRPQIARVFDGVSRILHAGDVGGAAVLRALEAIAPVDAVFVVPGRPRYHVEGCRFLAGRDVDALPVVEAPLVRFEKPCRTRDRSCRRPSRARSPTYDL